MIAASDDDAPHEVTLARANTALTDGRFADAAAAFDETAQIELAADRPLERSHALRFAAVSFRIAGQAGESLKRARLAAELVERGSPAAVAAQTEIGEALRVLGDPAAAAESYGAAAADGGAAGMPAAIRAALLRRKAAAQREAGHADEAVRTLREAATCTRSPATRRSRCKRASSS